MHNGAILLCTHNLHLQLYRYMIDDILAHFLNIAIIATTLQDKEMDSQKEISSTHLW